MCSMTPKEKAKELANKFYETCNCTIAGTSTIFRQIGVQAALIAVEEIEKAIHFDWMEVQNLDRQYAYWEQVKTELNKL